jgi:hypothetical protein
MNIWDPFHPIAYFLHTFLGVAGILGAIFALSLIKGSSLHMLAGRTFVVAVAVVSTTAIVFSFVTFAPMAIASAAMSLSAVGSAFLALRVKSTGVAAGELMTTTLMALALLWLSYGVMLSMPQGGLLWIPTLIFALCSAALLVNDIRFIRLDDAARRSKRLPRHFSRMAFALAIAVHAPIVVFADDLGIHPGLAFYGPFIIWPVIYFFFKSRIKNNTLVIVERQN